jgi:uncharacterized protein
MTEQSTERGAEPDSYPSTTRTISMRERDRMSYDRSAAHAVLDEGWHCTLSFVVDGEPRALPTLYVRIGDTVYLHGSTGSRPLLAARPDGIAVCVSVTHLDGLVLARSQFHHSANYRSLVAHGVATLVTDEAEKLRALTALVERIAAGRAADTRPPNPRELAQTALLALPLREVSVRARTGGVNDEPADLDLPHWAGVVPMTVSYGVPRPDSGVTTPAPDYLRPFGASRWREVPTLRGDLVTLEPLSMAHVDGLFAAYGHDEEVWRWTTYPVPRHRDDIAAQVADALEHRAAGVRAPWAQLDSRTGEVIGTTSFYDLDEANRSLEIGGTVLARSAWRSGRNTEAKLLLLERAFDVLGCERVTWRTHASNLRSQAAIERLGATREGVIRRHKLLFNGLWRDSVVYGMLASEWPTAQRRLRNRLRESAPTA